MSIPASSIVTLPPLTAVNFSNWKFRIEVYLEKESVRDVLHVTEGDILAMDSAQKTTLEIKDKKARWTIVQSVSDKHLEIVRGTPTARAMVKSLENFLARKSPIAKLFVMKKLVQLKLQKADLQDHFVKLEALLRELEAAGTGMSGAGAGHDSMRDVGGRQLRRRAPVVQEATSPNPNSNSQPNRGVDDTRRAEDYEAPLPQGSPAVRRRAARRREDTRRLKRTVEMNIELMRTFYIINHCSDEPLPGWRHSLHAEFLRRNPTFNISEQNIVDRKNVIVRKRYLTDLQLQEVKREVDQILFQQQEFRNLSELRAEEEIQPQQRPISRTPSSSRSERIIRDGHLPRSQHEERRERFLQLVTHYEFMNPLNRPRTPKLRNQVYTPNPNRKNKDIDTPMWKKRLEKNIDEYRADADVLSEFLAGNNSRRVMAKTQAIARKAQIDLNNADHRQQLLNLKHLRQKAKAKGARLRRYKKLTKIKQQNAAFENNQKQFLRSFVKQGEDQPAEIDPNLSGYDSHFILEDIATNLNERSYKGCLLDDTWKTWKT
ncbi:hypothetical protein NQ318_010574 [Aromia moschata]|uniref:Uncharacterized protein n=1 Tax=Aromia moschata TaxID=1265417 RepID=A0AAV8XAV7_9CUCU|nr:hypothetical protein NQ318_010574 [Aromia moschata]